MTLHKGKGLLQQMVMIGSHRLPSDAPAAHGGEDSGPEPRDLLAAALATCTAPTVTVAARRKGMALEDGRVGVTHGSGDGYGFVRRAHARLAHCSATAEFAIPSG